MSIFETDKEVRHAILFARAMHYNQKYGDHDYVDYHLMGVAKLAMQFSEAADIGLKKVAIVAILHDCIEDTPANAQMVASLFGNDIASAVSYLTREKGLTREEYLERLVGSSSLVLLVKKADTLFNLQNSVMANNVGRINTYQKQLAFLVG